MALSREYRIRELHLNFLEENFPTKRRETLVSELEECERKLITHFSRIRRREDANARDAILDAYAYSLFETLSSRRYRISPLRDLARFRRHLDPGDRQNLGTNQSLVSQALSYCKIHELLPEEEFLRLALSIALFLTFLESASDLKFQSFSNGLRRFVLSTVNELLDDATYDERLRLYGRLIQTTTSPESAVEALRLSLQCFPTGDQRSSNTFLYVVSKVTGLWPEVGVRLLHVPVDTDLTRVATRIGLTKSRLSNLEYNGISYAAVQSIARRLQPGNPVALYGLKYVAKVWCRPRSPNCAECPMNQVCTYAQTIIL